MVQIYPMSYLWNTDLLLFVEILWDMLFVFVRQKESESSVKGNKESVQLVWFPVTTLKISGITTIVWWASSL